MPEAFLNWAHGFHDFYLIGVAIAIVALIVGAGYRRCISKSSPSANVVTRARRRIF
jgi:hypothetical protein